MRWQKKHAGGSVSDIYYPSFEADDCVSKSKKGSTVTVSYMNDFYSELVRCATEYSQTLGTGYCYYADFGINDEDGSLTVTVTLRLRHRGRTIAQKKLMHMWSDGVIIMSNVVTA